MKKLLRTHWLLAIFLVVGLALRVLATVAYRPSIIYTDSVQYLNNMKDLKPDQLNPIGYDFVLRPLVDVAGLTGVVIVQHLAGLGLAVAIYALARRLGVYRWLSALAAAPILLDAYQVQIEQNIMAETTFDVLLVAVLWILLGWGKPGWKRAALAGLLLGAAFAVRTIGLTLVVAMVLYLVVVGSAWRHRRGQLVLRTGAALAGFALVVVAYAGYFHAETGRWAISGAENQVLYGRTAVVADCEKLPLNEGTKLFCPKEPLGHRLGVDKYAHNHYGDPNWPGPLPPGTTKQQLAEEFSGLVIRHQPFDVAWAVAKDFLKGFAPTRTTSPDDVPLERWQFQLTYPNLQDPNTAIASQTWGGMQPHVNHGPAVILRAYQLNGGYTSGLLLGIAVLIALAAVAGLRRAKRSGLRAAVLLPLAGGLILLLGSAAFEFSWRYQLPGLILFPLAGAIGLRAILGADQARPPMAAYPDQVDSEALDDFKKRHGEPAFAPLVVVIAAYNEAAGIGPVLDQHAQDVRRSACRRTGGRGRSRGRHCRNRRCGWCLRLCCPAQPWSRRRAAAGLSPCRAGRSGVRRHHRRGRAVRQRRARRTAEADPGRASRLRDRFTPAGRGRRGQQIALARSAGLRDACFGTDSAAAHRHVVRVPRDAGATGQFGDAARTAVPVLGAVARSTGQRRKGRRVADDDAPAR